MLDQPVSILKKTDCRLSLGGKLAFDRLHKGFQIRAFVDLLRGKEWIELTHFLREDRREIRGNIRMLLLEFISVQEDLFSLDIAQELAPCVLHARHAVCDLAQATLVGVGRHDFVDGVGDGIEYAGVCVIYENQFHAELTVKRMSEPIE